MHKADKRNVRIEENIFCMGFYFAHIGISTPMDVIYHPYTRKGLRTH